MVTGSSILARVAEATPLRVVDGVLTQTAERSGVRASNDAFDTIEQLARQPLGTLARLGRRGREVHVEVGPVPIGRHGIVIESITGTDSVTSTFDDAVGLARQLSATELPGRAPIRAVLAGPVGEHWVTTPLAIEPRARKAPVFDGVRNLLEDTGASTSGLAWGVGALEQRSLVSGAGMLVPTSSRVVGLVSPTRVWDLRDAGDGAQLVARL